jgi:hypothetical protein
MQYFKNARRLIPIPIASFAVDDPWGTDAIAAQDRWEAQASHALKPWMKFGDCSGIQNFEASRRHPLTSGF